MKPDFQQIGRACGAAAFSVAIYFTGFLIFLTPLPLFYLSLLTNKKYWFTSLGLTLLMGALLFFAFFPETITGASILPSSIMTIGYFGYYLTIALLLSVGVWKKWRLERMGWVTTLTVTLLALLVGAFFQWSGLVDVKGLIDQFLGEISITLDQMIATQPKEKQAEMAMIVEQSKEWLAYFPSLIPVIVTIFTLLTVIVNIGIPRLFYRVAKPMKWAGDFRRLQMPSFLVWLLIASGGLFFINQYTIHLSLFKVASVNLLIAVLFVYFLQGLSIMAFFLKRYSLLFRFGIYGLLILFFQMVGLVVVGLGLADMWVDFRKLHKQPVNK